MSEDAAIFHQGYGRGLEKQKLELGLVTHPDVKIVNSVQLTGIDGEAGDPGWIESELAVGDSADDLLAGRPRKDRSVASSFADRALQARIREAEYPQLGDADDEGEEDRRNKCEFERPSAALVSAKARLANYHWTLNEA
jgi:hypothetical protein